MRHGVENHIYPAKKHLMLCFLIAIAVTGFSFFSSAVYAAPSVTCPAGNCTGSAPEIAHCMTTTGTAACASGGKCVAQGCKGGCVGSFFAATGSAESNNDYTAVGAAGGCSGGNAAMGQWQLCSPADATRFCATMTDFYANKDYCQDRDIISYQEGNWTAIKGSLAQYIGQTKVVNGVTFTISQAGIMGAAHLCGVGGATSFFKKGSNPGDQHGTNCAQYFANFNNTVLPPQFMDASTYAKATTDGSCPQTAQQQPGGQSAASPGTSVASTPSATTSAPAASTSAASSPSSSMSSMMPMMMMSMMMQQMMQQMKPPSNGSGGSGSGGSGQQDMLASLTPLLDALKSLLNGAPADQSSSGSGSGSGSGAPQSPIVQQLEQLQAEQQQQQAASTGTPSSAILSQPEATPAAPGKKHKDYRISCASMSTDPSVEGCRSFVPGGQ